MGCCGDCCVPPKESREPIRYDPNFNGPIHNRSCTDILFLIIYILFLGVWVYVGYFSITRGNMDKLLAPMDSQGRRCGLDSSLKDKPYLVFFDISKCLSPNSPITGCQTPQVCVKKCPQESIYFSDRGTFELHKASMVCTSDIDMATLTWDQASVHITNNKCTEYVIRSQPVFNRCFLNVTEAIHTLQQFDKLIGVDEEQVLEYVSSLVQYNELSAQIVQDLVQSRWYMLGALVAVVVICFIYILLLRWVVAPVVWASIAGLFCLLGFSLYFCYTKYAYYKAHPVTMIATTNLKGYAQSIFSKHETYLGILIALAIVTLILLLMIIFLRARIVIAIALIREGSKAVYAVKSTIFFPIFPWILQCLTIGYGVLVLMYLMSIGESAFSVLNLTNDTNCDCKGTYTEDYQSCDPLTFVEKCHDKLDWGLCKTASCHFTAIDNPQSVYWMHLLNLLGFFWTMYFISGIADMMLASTFSTWYWTFQKRDVPFFTLTSGIYRTIRYHMGTVAFGSLIIAIVSVIRVILEYIDHKLKKFDNPFTRCILCFCKCFFWCLESFLKFINKNAYIMCAVHGKAFCASARDAFSLLLRNIVRVVVLDKVTDFIFFLSKALISVGVGFAVYYLLDWSFWYEVAQGQRLHYNYIPAIILSVATYLISSIFFNVYAMAVDTLFLCFLEDCERNDGSPEKPYFMSKNLMKILGKKNKRE